MNNIYNDGVEQSADFFLDISDEVCPLTFVRTRLLIDRMAAGQTAEIRLSGTEPVQNVPRSVTSLGHEIVSMEAEQESEGARTVYRLRVRKR